MSHFQSSSADLRPCQFKKGAMREYAVISALKFVIGGPDSKTSFAGTLLLDRPHSSVSGLDIHAIACSVKIEGLPQHSHAGMFKLDHRTLTSPAYNRDFAKCGGLMELRRHLRIGRAI